MKYTTYVCGVIDIDNLPAANKMQIRNYLEEIYHIQVMGQVYSDTQITINDEWNDYEDSDKFIITLYKIVKFLDQETEALIMCNGEREGDIWGLIIKKNKLFSQRYQLKPVGEPEEYERVR